MLIIFDERQKKDLGFLRDQPIESILNQTASDFHLIHVLCED